MQLTFLKPHLQINRASNISDKNLIIVIHINSEFRGLNKVCHYQAKQKFLPTNNAEVNSERQLYISQKTYEKMPERKSYQIAHPMISTYMCLWARHSQLYQENIM